MDKLLSIIIPVYNGEEYIRGMLDSLLKVDFPLLELLLIDDGSTDSGASVILEYIRQDSRIQYVYEENRGIAEARNHGLRLAKGKYVCFFDQDDLVNMNVYIDLASKMLSSDAQVGICNTGRYIRGNKSDYEKIREAVYKNDEVKRGLLYPLLFRGYENKYVEGENYLYGTVWKFVFHKEFLEKNQIRFIRFVSYEDDWIFVTSALSKADTVVTSDKVGYYWRINDLSESHAGKYVDHICSKMNRLDRYMEAFLVDAMDKEAYELYQRIQYADHFMEYLTNQWKGRKQPQSSDYFGNVQNKFLIPTKGIRKRIVLRTMNCIGLKAAYYMNGMLLAIEDISTRMKFAVWIERHGKLVGQGTGSCPRK